jgi:hypothetical protein
MSVEKMHVHPRSFSHPFIVKEHIVNHSMGVQYCKRFANKTRRDRSHENAVLAAWCHSKHIDPQQKLSKKDKICQNTGTSS